MFTTKPVLGRPISDHVARSFRVHALFAACMTFGLVLLALYVFGWFVPQYGMHWLFVLLVLVALLLELVTTWVPLTDGWKHTVHDWASYTTALMLPAILAWVALSSAISLAARLIAAACMLVILGCITLFFVRQSQRRYYLVYQIIYILCFFCGLLCPHFLM